MDSSYDAIVTQREAYISKIKAYEELARKDPGKYRLRVRLFAWLGYLYVVGLVILAFLSLGAFVLVVVNGGFSVGGFLVIPILLLWAVGRAFFARIPNPSGILLERADAPKLFDAVDEIAKSLKAPKVHSIYINGSFNAFAMEKPLIGLLGPFQNFVVIGLPLMLACSEGELRSVIAHELGHISHAHGKEGAKIYRLDAIWASLWHQFKSRHHVGEFVASFTNWYVPRLDALTFPLRRLNEYEADAAAIQVAGKENTTLQFGRISVFASKSGSAYWRRVYDGVLELESPPDSVFEGLGAFFDEGVSHDDAIASIKERVGEETSYADTHPCLRERVQAIGIASQFANETVVASLADEIRKAPKPNSAEVLLGSSLPKISNELSRRWKESIYAEWRKKHKEQVQISEQLGELEQPANSSALSAEDLAKKANLVKQLKGYEEAAPLYRELLALDSENPDANFALGMLLASERDPSAEVYLVKSFQCRPELTESASERLLELFDELKDREKASHYYEILKDINGRREARSRAGRIISQSDRFTPFEMDAERKRKLIEKLVAERVKAAYLVRKEVPGADPISILVIDTAPPPAFFQTTQSNKARQQLVSRAVKWCGTDWVRVPGGKDKWLLHRLKKMPGAKIYG